MKFERGADAAGLFDHKFWIIHLALPLVVAITVLSSLERTDGMDR